MPIAAIAAVASLAATAVGTVISAQASKREGQVANSVAQYNAQISENNKQRYIETSKEIKTQVVEQKADIMQSTSQSRLEMLRRLGSTKAKIAGRGVQLDSGSPLNTLIDEATQMNLAIIDQSRSRISNITNLNKSEFDARWGAYEQDTNKALYTASGQNALAAGKAGQVGTLLSGAAQFGSNLSTFRSNNIL